MSEISAFGSGISIGSDATVFEDVAPAPATYSWVLFDDWSRTGLTQWDNFERTVSSPSWGTATPSGAVWGTPTVYGGATVFVSVGSAHVNMGTNDGAEIGTTQLPSGISSTSNFDMTSRFSFPLIPTTGTIIPTLRYTFTAGGSDFLYIDMLAYWGTNALEFSWADNTIYADMTFVQGDWYWVRLAKSGSSVMVKVWADGDPEPGWTLSGTASAPTWASPISLIVKPNNFDGNFQVSIDSIGFTRAADGSNVIASDDLTNDIGYSVNPVNLWFASAFEWSVDGSSATVVGTYNNGQIATNPYGNTMPYSGIVMPWQSGTWAMKTSVRFHWNDPTDQFIRGFEWGPHGGGITDFISFSPTDGSDGGGPWGYISAMRFNGTSNEFVLTFMTFENDALYHVIAEHTLSTNLLRAKIWKDGTTEPTAWTVSLAASNTTSPYYFRMNAVSNAAPDTWKIYPIYYASPSE